MNTEYRSAVSNFLLCMNPIPSAQYFFFSYSFGLLTLIYLRITDFAERWLWETSMTRNEPFVCGNTSSQCCLGWCPGSDSVFDSIR